MTKFIGWDGWQVLDQAGRRKYLSADERARFLDAADCLAPGTRALCHLLAYTGCRMSEALSLSPHHVDTERSTVTIRTLERRRALFRVAREMAKHIYMRLQHKKF